MELKFADWQEVAGLNSGTCTCSSCHLKNLGTVPLLSLNPSTFTGGGGLQPVSHPAEPEGEGDKVLINCSSSKNGKSKISLLQPPVL